MPGTPCTAGQALDSCVVSTPLDHRTPPTPLDHRPTRGLDSARPPTATDPARPPTNRLSRWVQGEGVLGRGPDRGRREGPGKGLSVHPEPGLVGVVGVVGVARLA